MIAIIKGTTVQGTPEDIAKLIELLSKEQNNENTK